MGIEKTNDVARVNDMQRTRGTYVNIFSCLYTPYRRIRRMKGRLLPPFFSAPAATESRTSHTTVANTLIRLNTASLVINFKDVSERERENERRSIIRTSKRAAQSEYLIVCTLAAAFETG